MFNFLTAAIVSILGVWFTFNAIVFLLFVFRCARYIKKYGLEGAGKVLVLKHQEPLGLLLVVAAKGNNVFKAASGILVLGQVALAIGFIWSFIVRAVTVKSIVIYLWLQLACGVLLKVLLKGAVLHLSQHMGPMPESKKTKKAKEPKHGGTTDFVDPTKQHIQLKDPYTGKVYTIDKFCVFICADPKSDACTIFVFSRTETRKIITTRKEAKRIIKQYRKTVHMAKAA